MLLDPYQSIRIPLMGDIADLCIQFLPKSKTGVKKAFLYKKDFSQQNTQNSLSTMKKGGWSGTERQLGLFPFISRACVEVTDGM